MKNKIIYPSLFLIITASILSITGCSSEDPQTTPEAPEETADADIRKIDLKLTSDLDLSTVFGNSLESSENYFSRKSGLTVSVHDNGTFGDSDDLIAGVKLGTIGLTYLSTETQSELVPETVFLDTPGIFQDDASWEEWMQTGFLTELAYSYKELGLKFLGCYSTGSQILISNTPITEISQLEGKTIGICHNSYLRSYWEQFGLNVQYIGSDLYEDARSRNFDVLCCTAEEYYNQKLQDVMKYVLITNLTQESGVLLMNQDLYDKMSFLQQSEIQSWALSLMSEQSITDRQNAYQTLISKLSSAKTTLSPSYEFSEALTEGRNVVLKQLGKSIGEEELNEMLNQWNLLR